MSFSTLSLLINLQIYICIQSSCVRKGNNIVADPITEKIDQYFASGYRCAESVLLYVAESKNIQSDLIPKIATGFCAGISRTRGTCGAVAGAVMAINMFYGRSNPSVPLDQSYPPVQKFIHLFEEKFGSTNCLQLIDCDLGTEEGRKKFLDANIITTCKNLTSEATRMALSIIDAKL
jgi:C_GCAxxG_C_C family probable redox protein